MRNSDKSAVPPKPNDSHVRELLLEDLARAEPSLPRRKRTAVQMSSVAAALAVLPGENDEPRVIRQSTSIFFVSHTGGLWRVFDAESPDSADPQMPSAESGLPVRLFMALARDEQLRVHRFNQDESRDVDPSTLQRQLDDSASI